jgi:hypothetical protein
MVFMRSANVFFSSCNYKKFDFSFLLSPLDINKVVILKFAFRLLKPSIFCLC